MADNPTVVVVGSVNADIVLSVPHFPEAGETLAATGSENFTGGKGANQATAAARLGAPVAFVGRTGADGAGEQARAALEAEGIDLTHTRTDEESPTGFAVVMVDTEAENSIVIVGGANAAMDDTDVAQARGTIAGARVVVCQLEVPQEVVAGAFAAADGITVLNAAPASPVSPEILSRTDILVVNEGEYRTLGGEELHAQGATGMPETVILTLGGRGARILRAGADPVDVAAPAVDVVDTTGAGDTFVGAVAEALARGEDVEAAVRRAVTAASAAVRGLGATSAMPTKDEVDRLLADPPDDPPASNPHDRDTTAAHEAAQESDRP